MTTASPRVPCPNPNCAGTVLRSDRMCSYCKHRLTSCPNCGEVMDAEFGLCANCGYGLADEEMTERPEGIAVRPSRVSENLPSLESLVEEVKGPAPVPPKPVVLEFRAPADEIVGVLAEAYHTAALNVADMHRVVEGLETIRRVLRSETDALKLWDALDEQIGKADLKRAMPAMVQVRDWFRQALASDQIQRLHRSFERDREMGWQEWQTIFAEALAYWRVLTLCKPLVEETFPFPESALASLDFERLVRMVACRRWAESYPLFEYLGGLDFLHPIVRARLTVSAALIQLYHFYKPDVALELLRRALALAPDHYDVYVGWGRYWTYQNNYESAEEYLTKATDMAPDKASGYVYMSELKESQGEVEAAIDYVRQAIDRDASDGDGYAGLLRLYGKPEMFPSYKDSLVRLAERAIALAPADKAYIYRELGNAYRHGDEYEEAYKWYQKAIDTEPDYLDGYTDLGYAFVEKKDFEAAQQSFDQAIQIAEGAVEGYWGMAWLYEQQKRWADALDWYQKCLPRRQQWTALINSKIAEMHLKLEQFSEAEGILLQTLELEPDNASAKTQLLGLAEKYYKSEDNTDAAQHVYDELLRIVGDEFLPAYHNRIGNMKYGLKEYQDAVLCYLKAIEADPKVAVYYSNLGGAYRNLQAWEQARAAYQKASDLAPDDQEYHRDQGLVYNEEGNAHYSAGNYAMAIGCYERALEYLPNDAVIYGNLSRAWLARTDIDYAQCLSKAQAVLERGMAECQDTESIERELSCVKVRSRLQDLGGLARGGQSREMLPLVTPIAVEVAPDIIPVFEEQDAPGMATFSAMRARILDATGVTVPGVRVRGNETDLPDGVYIIMLNEVPLVSGSSRSSQVWTSVPGAELKAQGIAFEEAANPVDGSTGAWISVEYASNPDIPSWGVGEYVARHLEAVLLRNLAMFAGHTEVTARLSDSQSGEARAISEDPALLTAFTRTLQALLREGVPTTDFRVLCEAFLQEWSKTQQLDQTVAALRLLPNICEKLPGNQPSTTLLRLKPELEQALQGGLQKYSDMHILAIEPELAQSTLSAIRDVYDPEQTAAIVCHDNLLRPYIRLLVEPEFASLNVIAESELAPERLDKAELEIAFL